MVMSCILKTRADREILHTILEMVTPKYPRPALKLETPKSVAQCY